MTLAIWIAIAAIITPIISAWTLELRRERKNKLAAATKLTPYPKTTVPVESGQISLAGFLKFLRRRWFTSVIQFVINAVCISVLWAQVWNVSPVSGRMVVLIAVSTAALMGSLLLPFTWNRE